MSPAQKKNTKWLLTVMGSVASILLIVITATAAITTRFNNIDSKLTVNEVDHTVIKAQVAAEVERATTIDNQREVSLEKMNKKLDELSKNNIEVTTNQEHLMKSVDKVQQSIEKIEAKL